MIYNSRNNTFEHIDNLTCLLSGMITNILALFDINDEIASLTHSCYVCIMFLYVHILCMSISNVEAAPLFDSKLL